VLPVEREMCDTGDMAIARTRKQTGKRLDLATDSPPANETGLISQKRRFGVDIASASGAELSPERAGCRCSESGGE